MNSHMVFFYVRKNVESYSLKVIFFIICLATFVPAISHAQNLTPEQRIKLQAELQQIEAEEAKAQENLKKAQSQSASLSKDISVLEARIKAAQLDIRAKTLLIQSLGEDITDKQKHIEKLEARINRGKATLADLLRKTGEMSEQNVATVILSQKSVSNLFYDIDSFSSVGKGLQNVFEELRADQASTTAEKNELDQRRNAAIDARHAIEVQRANIKSDQDQQKVLLNISKGNESAYKSVVAEKQAKAAEIRSTLFALSGAQAIPFGDALNYANSVYQKTGVQPAFLLAILTQETNIGKNVGTCYLTNTETGAGINVRTQQTISRVMKPDRDVKPFIQVTQSLGLDYKTMPVSCPQSIGFGGAMGPAQFIPSTWVLPSIRDVVIQYTGSSNPNPWKPYDAFMASGVYLANLGANSTSYSAQRNAACRYYSGRPCGAVTGSSSYGNNVMALMDRIQQTMINPLQGY